MAVTIEQQPTGVLNAYNPIDYVVSSNNTSEDSFKFIVDLYVDGVNVHRYLVPVDPNYTQGFINTSNVVESYLTFDFDSGVSDIIVEQCTNSIKESYIEFGEQYEVAGVLTDFTNLTTSDTIHVTNGSLDFESYINFNYEDYQVDGTGDNKFLTNAPTTRTVKYDVNSWLYSLVDQDTIYPDTYIVKTYDSNGTLNGQFQISNTYIGAGGITSDIMRIPTGANLNNVTVNFVVLGATPILDSDVASYTIQLFDNGITSTSELRTFNIDYSCNGLDKYTLHFLNDLGGFDTFTFDLVNRVGYTKEVSNYKSVGYSRSSGAVSRSTATHQRKSYNTTTKKSVSLISDWITEAESEWLRELFDSPVIFMEDPNGQMIAISGINLTSKTQDITKVDKLFNLELEAFYSFDSYRQRW